ncbi:phosphoribosylanthranilate isomerase [Duganella sp. CF458]|uniref:phosphoribosylanthranilate isomerase n=1 Tax=Duganella sp. CF458 TaxID=1884368 RepID=UPI0008F10CBD|nr:phosphoribosylanthranilate isomerase [Duganella sp. CF458]SFG27903.1 phosphoribosylanthranilate isomerase [Duganella sp. CF458]
MPRTRIKICGLTREEDVQAAVAAGADAVGFVFYDKSPRYVTPARAAELIALLPPFVTPVGLFVNHTAQQVAATVALAPVSLLQFHGDETAQQCAEAARAAGRAFVRVFRVKPDTSGAELLEYEQLCRASSSLFSGLLLDTFVDAYGGAGKVFDWSLIPKDLAHRAVLSGGLSVQNVTGAVASVRPYAVDVSSGVERAKGIKDARLIADFIRGARAADATIEKDPHHENPA